MPLSAWRKWWRCSTPRSKKLNKKKHTFRKCFLEVLEDRTLLSANLYTVNLASDNVANTGQENGDQFHGDLRWCIEQANLNPGSTIQFDNAVFPLTTTTTIRLSQGELQIAASMDIQGEGSDVITVSGNDGKGGASRVFDITSSTATVTISGVTIANGNAAPNYTPVSGNQGGDIFNGGQLTLQNDVVTNGSSVGSVGGPNGRGGAIYNAEGKGTTVLILDGTTVENSTARGPNGGGGAIAYVGTSGTNITPIKGGAGGPGQGGGIYNDVSALLIVEDGSQGSLISGNTALGGNGGNGGGGVTITAKGAPGGDGGKGGNGGFAEGGGIYNAGTLNITGTSATSILFQDNTAQGGQGGLGHAGGNGVSGARGGNGGASGSGGDGGPATGGAIFNTGSAGFTAATNISLQYVSFLGDQAIGGSGNNGNVAGNAGNGTKVSGGTGGEAGHGGAGGTAQGGGIYTNWGSLSVATGNPVVNVLFGLDGNGVSDQALGGAGGNGGAAGNGGASSGGVAFGRGNQGGPSGNGGVGGNGGFAAGGAFANVPVHGGNVAFTNTTFDSTVARAGNGGNGGASGQGGQGAQANEGSKTTPYSAGLGGVGEPGGNAGAGGSVSGGGVYNATGSLSIIDSIFLSDQAFAGFGGNGGTGGVGGIGGNKTSKSLNGPTFTNGGPGGMGGAGAAGGNAQGGGFYNLVGAVSVLDSTFEAKNSGGIGNEAVGGSGGGGGAGGTGGQGGDGTKVPGGAAGNGGDGGLSANGGFAEGGAGGNEGGNTSLTGDIFSSSLVGLGIGGLGGNGGRGGDGGDDSNGHGGDGIGGNGGNASDGSGFNVFGSGFNGSAFGGAFADTAGNLTVSNGTFTGNQVVGGAGGAGGVGGGWGHWGHRGSNAYVRTSSRPLAGNGGHGGLGAWVYGGALSVGANAHTVQISSTTFTSSSITSGNGGNGGQAGLFSFDGAYDGINGIGGDGGLAQGGAVSISANASQSATLNNVTITSSSATGGTGGTGAVNFLQSVTNGYGGGGGENGFGSKGGNGGSVQGVGLAAVSYNVTINGPSSFDGGTGQAGMGGTGGTETVPEPITWAGGAGGNGGNILGGGIFFSNNTSSTLKFIFNTGSASKNTLNGGVGGNGGNAGASGHSNIDGGAGGNGGNAQGGGIYILAGSSSINNTSLGSLLLDGNDLVGGMGGVGGAGALANGGIGGNADGGGLYNSSSNAATSSSLNLNTSTLAGNQVTSGIGGDAGSGTTPNGGKGGVGGNAGSAEGGGLFDGTHTSLNVVNSTFGGDSTNATTPNANANILIGSRGGRGGDAGTPTGVPSNNGGKGGNGGSVEGGNVYVGGGSGNFINDTIVFGQAASVGLGGSGGSGAGKGGTNGASGFNGIGLAGGFFATATSTESIGNTIIDLNSANVVPSVSADVSGNFTSLGNNVLGNNADSNGFTGSGDQINVTAAKLFLGPLLNNGGPTLTDALLNTYNPNTGTGATSVAIDAGGNTLVTSVGNPWYNLFGPTPTDQRGTGFPRINNNTVDIGAFEFNPPVISSLTTNNTGTNSEPEQGPPFVLIITGTGFATGATVSWNYTGDAYVAPSTTVLTPSSVSLTQIQVTIPSQLLPDEGTVDVTVSVPDGSGISGETLISNTATFNITDSGTLTLSNPGNQNSSEGDPVKLDPITSSDPGTTFSDLSGGLDTLPPGLSIDPITGIISGNIGLRAAGTYNVTIDGIDPDTHTVEGNVQFTWTVADTTPPALTAPLTQNNNEGDILSAANNNTVTVSAVDADPGTFTDVLAGKHTLPTGLTIDANGVISGTIGSRAAGTYTVTITASDNGNSSDVSFQWIVADTTPPTVTDPSNQTDNEGQTITPLTIQSVDADSFNITGLPGGLTYNTTTGTISGMVGDYAAGKYTVTVTATDNGYQSTPVQFTWTVNDTTPPTISYPAISSGTVNNNEGDSVDLKAQSQDAQAGSFTATNLPKGVNIDANTGEISGTIDPRAAGTYNVTVNALDAAGNQGSTTFTWIVADTTPPVVTNPGNQTSNENQTIATLNIASVDADSFTITGLPGGLTYSTKTGAISGTLGAYAAGSYSVTIVATDSGIQSTPVSFTWTVNDTTPPAITNPGAQSSNEGQTITPLNIQAMDAESFTITGLPTGLTYDPTKGVISGTIGTYAAGSYPVTVTAFDGALSSSVQFTWTVNDTSPPLINNPGSRNNSEGDTVNLQIGSTDADAGSFTDVSNGQHTLPTGLSIDPNSGLISGTIGARAAGTYTVTISANDGANNVGSTTFTWNVADTTPPSLTQPQDQNSNEGAAVNLPIQSVDADSFSATGLPKGLSIDATTGTISGNIDSQAADSSPYTVTVFATDNGNTSSVSFKWTVNDTTPPSFTNPGDQINNEGDPVNIATNPVGADPGTITATGLPPGLSINSTSGVISGTISPYGAGAYSVTISGSDNGNSSSISLVWRVNDTTPPMLFSPGTQVSNNGTSVSVAVRAVDADAGTFVAKGLPAGLSINANTGVISGTVMAGAGTYSVTVTASDSGNATSVSFNWVVNQLPISVNITNVQNAYVGVFQIEKVTAQVSDPSGITINSGTVTFQLNGQTLSAPVINGFATITFVTPIVSFDTTILMDDFFAHNLDAVFSDPTGLFGTAGSTVSEPAMLLDFMLFLQANQFGSLASQLAQLEQNQ